MITFSEAEKMLQGAVCPECLHSELSTRLHLQDESECLCTARCEHCGKTFNVEFTRFESLNRIQRRIETELESTPCQGCGEIRYGLALQCDRSTKDCYFESNCRNCGALYRVEDHAKHIHLERTGLEE